MQTKTYQVWAKMIQRCENPNHPKYPDYGGRGITVCSKWRWSFKDFLADMGEAPPGLLLDRENNNGNYEPGNCRWVTPKVSVANRRPRRVNPNSFNQRALRSGVGPKLVRWRIQNGWTEEEAFSVPARNHRPYGRRGGRV